LFGEGLNADKVISYAGSFGATTVEKLQELGIKDVVASLLAKIDKISIRDANSFDAVKTLTGVEPEKHLDPVLIYNYDHLLPATVPLKDYMIVYTYPGRIKDKGEIAAIKSFAKLKGLKLISIGHYFSWCDDVVVPHPFEVLAYFKNASYIVTDTFHGSVFSIKYNKAFATVVRGMNSNKLTHLLEQFNLTSRIIHNLDHLPKILEKAIDYVPINGLITNEAKRSYEYLKNNIKKTL